MKHFIKDNQILRSVSGLPEYFTRENGEVFCGGYQNRTDIHYEDGWRDEIVPSYDPNISTLSAPFYDEANDIVTYTVEDRTDLPTLEEAKASKIAEIKEEASQGLLVTDWYVARYSETGTAIPENILTERANIRAQSNIKEAEISAMTDIKDVLNYNL